MVAGEIVPVPVLAALVPVWAREAAAICDGLLSVTARPAVATAVGRIRKPSPAAAAPLTTIDRPAACSGLVAVPAPVSATFCPVVTSCICQAPPEKRRV